MSPHSPAEGPWTAPPLPSCLRAQGQALGAPPCRWTGGAQGEGGGLRCSRPRPPSSRGAPCLFPATPVPADDSASVRLLGPRLGGRRQAGLPGPVPGNLESCPVLATRVGLATPRENCPSQDSGSGATGLNPGACRARWVRTGRGPFAARSRGGVPRGAGGVRRALCRMGRGTPLATQRLLRAPGPPHPLPLAGSAACTARTGPCAPRTHPAVLRLGRWGLAVSRGCGGACAAAPSRGHPRRCRASGGFHRQPPGSRPSGRVQTLAPPPEPSPSPHEAHRRSGRRSPA